MTRLLFAVFLFLGFAQAASAEPPVCGGKNLLDEMRTNDPATYQAVMDEAKAIPNSEAVLWRVAGKDGAADSHLFGTAHVTDPRITTLPEKAAKALDHAKIVALELRESADRSSLMKAMFKHIGLIGMPIGEQLWDVVPDEKEPLIKKSPQITPGSSAAFSGLQPWVVAMALSIPLCEQTRQQAGVAVLDQAIGERALANLNIQVLYMLSLPVCI